jgi:predicted SAM-dependent methyltransferase
MSVRTERVGAALHRFPSVHGAANHARQLLCVTRRRSQIRKYLSSTSSFAGLQIGAGRHYLEGWLKTDLEPTDLETVYVDARKRLPFDTETFDYIVAEHLIEHLEYRDAMVMLKECFRVLKKNGVIRVSTPNILLTHQLMSPPLTAVLKRYVVWSNGTFDGHIDTTSATHVVNRLQHAWGHKFLYDPDTLVASLRQCGFTDAVRRPPSLSEHPALTGVDRHAYEIGDEFNRIESLIMEATKGPE